MDYAIMILDAIITGALYLSPVIILRFAILKKGLKALSAAFVSIIMGYFSHLLCIGVYYLLFGFTLSKTSLPVFWVIINNIILNDHKSSTQCF